MQRLGAQAPEVPDHVRILQVRLRVSLLTVDKGRKLKTEKEKKIQKLSLEELRCLILYTAYCEVYGLEF